MEHEGDYYTNRDWCFWYSHQSIIKETGGFGNKWTSGVYPNYNIFQNGHNTDKSPGNVKTLVAYCHSHSSVRLSANADLKNSQRGK